MNYFFRIIVILLEVVYYTLFMKKARPEGKTHRYLLLFCIFSTISFFMDNKSIISYGLILLIILYGIKYIVNIKTSLFDLFFIFIMMIIKVLLEAPLAITIHTFVKDITICKIIMGLLKNTILFVISGKLSHFYKILHKKWDNNNFYVRYIFDVLMFIYIIVSCLFLIYVR